MDANTVNAISTGLTGFGNELLTNFTAILPALAGLAAILMVISIIRKKVRA